MKILLEWNINTSKVGKRGQTLLSCAASNGHEEVVKILIERDDINPQQTEKHGQRLLSCNVSHEPERVVKILLERNNANPDKPDNLSGTLLFYAASNGDNGVV